MVATQTTNAPMIAAVILGTLVGLLNYIVGERGVYLHLIEAFIHGRLDYITLPRGGVTDLSLFDGRYFSPFGVLPAVIGMPFVWLGVYHQGVLNFLAAAVAFAAAFRICRKSNYSSRDSSWLAIAFVFGSAYLEVALGNWHIAHTLGAMFVLLAILEFVGQRRPWLIGALVGCATACRPLNALNMAFFLAVTVDFESPSIRKALAVAAGFAVFALGIAWYNYARFGNPLETGYAYQLYSEGLPYSQVNIAGNLGGSMFALWHIPINAQTLFFGLPSPHHVGVSLFLMSPWLVYLIGGRKWELTDWLLAGTCLLACAALLAFRSTGMNQAGYRFVLEFMPLLWFLIVRRRDMVPTGFKSLIGSAVSINIGLFAYWVLMQLARS